LDHVPEEQELEEIAQFCANCGSPKGEFSLFCPKCVRPLIRRFKYLFSLEILAFLVAAVLLSLADQQRLPQVFLYAPLLFLVQLLGLYFVRLSLRQRRFLVLLMTYLVFVLAALSGAGLKSVFASVAPLYLAIGVIILWGIRCSETGRWGYLQTLWVGVLFAGWSLGAFASLEGALQSQVLDQRLLRVTSGLLKYYTPWFGLAGLCVTLAIQAGLRVAQQGISVKEDYYPNARIKIPSMSEPIRQPLPVVPIVVLGRALKLALIVFYNTLVAVLNGLTRCLVFIWLLLTSFASSLVSESLACVKRLVSFVFLCLVRVVTPLFAVYLIAGISIDGSSLIRVHAFSPSWGTTGQVVWALVQLVIMILASVACFARIRLGPFLNSFLADLAAVFAYGILVLLACSLALTLGTMGVRGNLGVDLGFRFRYLSYGSLIVLVLGLIWLWRKVLIAKLRLLQRGDD